MMVVVEVDVRRVAGSKPRVERPGLSTPEPVRVLVSSSKSLCVAEPGRRQCSRRVRSIQGGLCK